VGARCERGRGTSFPDWLTEKGYKQTQSTSSRRKKQGSLRCDAIARTLLGPPLKVQGNELFYRCPQHKPDSNPSLKINTHKNCWLCAPCGKSGNPWQLAAFFAGLDPNEKEGVKAFLKEHGLLNGKRPRKEGKERGPCLAEYVYSDASRNRVARKRRYEPGPDGKKKEFDWQRWENGKWIDGLAGLKTPLYRLAEIKGSTWVVVTEGEKDADEGARIGLPTTTSGGIGSWRDDHADSLLSKDVVITPDGDDGGRLEAEKRAVSLFGRARSIKLVELPGAKDLAEAIEKGTTCEALLTLFQNAPEWKPADGCEILHRISMYTRRFVAQSASQTTVVTLWIAHTHAFDAADFTPYLSISSPEKQSGKTRLLEVMRPLVRNPWLTGRVTAAVLVRKIDAECPVLLLDESDAAFSGEKEYAEALRGVLDTGHRRGGAASCCVGQGANIGYRDFSTFCPKAIAGIGKLPDTVANRSIPIRLKRAKLRAVERFREREVEREASDLRARLAAWCDPSIEKLRTARPAIPPELSDRQADVCEPLLAIADLAGGGWPEAARKALVELCSKAQTEDDSVGVQLLTDIRAVFYPVEDNGDRFTEVERIASSDLVKDLAAMEGRPWAEFGKMAKPITPNQVAKLLGRYEIWPKTMRLSDGRRLKGYEWDQFTELWELYLPPARDPLSAPAVKHLVTLPGAEQDSPSEPGNAEGDIPQATGNARSNGDLEPVTKDMVSRSMSRFEDTISANENGACHGVTVQKGGVEGAFCAHCSGIGVCPCGACTLGHSAEDFDGSAPCSMCRLDDHTQFAAWVCLYFGSCQ
jgi:hypothetical protein